MVKLLYAGFDTLDIAFQDALPEAVMKELDEAREQAEAQQEPALVRIDRTGSSSCAYRRLRQKGRLSIYSRYRAAWREMDDQAEQRCDAMESVRLSMSDHPSRLWLSRNIQSTTR